MRALGHRRWHVTALESSEKRYKGLFDNMQAGIALLEPVVDKAAEKIVDFRYVDVNGAYCGMRSETHTLAYTQAASSHCPLAARAHNQRTGPRNRRL